MAKHSSGARHHSIDGAFTLPVRLPHSNQQEGLQASNFVQGVQKKSIKSIHIDSWFSLVFSSTIFLFFYSGNHVDQNTICKVPPADDFLEIMPNICGCLLTLCGCGCSTELCSIIPKERIKDFWILQKKCNHDFLNINIFYPVSKLCNILAGLCGSLFSTGISSGQNYTPVTQQVTESPCA